MPFRVSTLAPVRYAKAEDEECRGRTQTMLETWLSNFSGFADFVGVLVRFGELNLKPCCPQPRNHK